MTIHDDMNATNGEGRPSVLVVEDDPTTLFLLTYVLKESYEVELAKNVGDAFSKAASKTFDALVLDVKMHEETEVDVLHALLDQPAYRDVPAVVCTTYAGPVDRQRFQAAGFVESTAHLFQKSDLVEAVEQVLGTGRTKPRKNRAHDRLALAS